MLRKIHCIQKSFCVVIDETQYDRSSNPKYDKTLKLSIRKLPSEWTRIWAVYPL